MKKRLMAVLLCVCMAAVLLTPYASVLTADGALRLGIAGAENGQDLTGESSSTPTEGGKATATAEPEATATTAPEATATAEPEATATAEPEATATTAPEATKAPAPKYTLDSNRAVYKDGATLRGEPKDCVVKASYSVAQAYKGPTDRSEAKTYAAGDRVRVYDEIQYEDCDGAEQKWSVVLDGSDFYFVLSDALEPAPELPAQTPAQTDMKSLFGIGYNVNPANIISPTTAVATYNFYNGNDLVDSQKIKNGESLKEPEPPATDEGQTFEGWFTEDGKKFTSFGTPLIVTETTTTPINLHARFKEAYHIYFYTANGSSVKFTKDVTSRGPHNFSDLSYNVGANIKVTGWAAEANGKTDISKNIVIPEEETSVNVYAIETEGYWVVFDTQGGTSVAPVFQAAGATLDLSTVTNPTRTGYEFKGWYDNKECTGDKVTTVSAAMTLDAKTTLYAKWIAQTAKLTVVFWYENADDESYGQAGTVQRPENTGATVTSSQYKDTPFDGRDDTHFTYNAAKAEDVTVKGDGSTVLNVYYTRNTYTLTFKKGKLTCGKVEHIHSHDQCCTKWWLHLSCNTEKCPNGGKEHTHDDSCYSDLIITAKYQADIHSNFPIKEGNDTIWWTVPSGCKSFVPGNYLGSIDTMPGENITFTKHASENGAKIYYYVETLNGAAGDTTYNGRNYKQYKVIDLEYDSDTNLTYAEEFHPITGFTQGDSDPKLPVGGKVRMQENNYLYYTRNSYALKFYNYNAELTTEQKTVQYEAPLSDYHFVPDYPTGLEENIYEFKGWYTTPDCYEDSKADLTKMTMPANDVTLYAKWVPKEFTVSFNLGYDNAPAAPESQTVEAKKKATKPADPTREGYRFVGWYDGDNKPFSFETEIVEDTALTAKWLQEGSVITVQYNVNGGGGTAPTDTTPYADGAGAVVKGKGDMTAPEGKEFFLGWATTSTATTAEYQPGGTMPIDANKANENRVITLYAVWGDKPATTTLTYNANYPNATPPTVQHKLNDSADLPNNTEVTLYGENTFTRQGYKLIGWNTDQTKANEGTVEYACNTDVIVDNLGATANILYAVWKQSTTTVTVKKVVEGNFGDKTKEFEFQYSADEGTTWIDFNLANDGIKSIESVQIGSTLLIREKKVDHYTVTATCGTVVEDPTNTSYWRITATNIVDKQEIVVTNNNTIIPDTGVILDSLPYVLILAVVALGAAGVVIRRRRSREDD